MLKLCVLQIHVIVILYGFRRGQIVCFAHNLEGSKSILWISHAQIVCFADQNVRFTNPGSKNCQIKIRLRRSGNLQKPLYVPLRVPGPTASSIRRSTTCTHFKKCFTHRERYIHTGRHHHIPPLRGATRHANASGVARNPTQNAHFGGNWRKIGLSRASIICVLQMHIMDFKTHNMDYFGRC